MTFDEGFQAGVLIVETRRLYQSDGVRLAELVEDGFGRAGGSVGKTVTVKPDPDLIAEQLALMADRLHLACIATIGGCGLHDDDVTPDATVQVIHRPTPGIPELLRQMVGGANPEFVLTRGIAGTRGRTLIVNLPDSPDDLGRCFGALYRVLPAAVRRLRRDVEASRQIRLL